MWSLVRGCPKQNSNWNSSSISNHRGESATFLSSHEKLCSLGHRSWVLLKKGTSAGPSVALGHLPIGPWSVPSVFHSTVSIPNLLNVWIKLQALPWKLLPCCCSSQKVTLPALSVAAPTFINSPHAWGSVPLSSCPKHLTSRSQPEFSPPLKNFFSLQSMNTFKQNTMNPVSPSTTASPTPLLFQVYSLTHLIDTVKEAPSLPSVNSEFPPLSIFQPPTQGSDLKFSIRIAQAKAINNFPIANFPVALFSSHLTWPCWPISFFCKLCSFGFHADLTCLSLSSLT